MKLFTPLLWQMTVCSFLAGFSAGFLVRGRLPWNLDFTEYTYSWPETNIYTSDGMIRATNFGNGELTFSTNGVFFDEPCDPIIDKENVTVWRYGEMYLCRLSDAEWDVLIKAFPTNITTNTSLTICGPRRKP